MFVDKAGVRFDTTHKARAVRRVTPLARHLVLAALEELREGSLVLRDGLECHRFGDGASRLRAEVRILDPRAYDLAVFRGEVGLGEAYTLGYWTSPDPVAVARVALRNPGVVEGSGGLLAALGKGLARWWHLGRANHREGALCNAAAHYDLGNAFYSLFLDPQLTYSCAWFEHPSQDLEAAQTAKFERICRKLDPGPEDHLLELGAGWGGFALHAARTRGCRVTTTTISRQQFELAGELIAQSGLGHRITLLGEDYRDVEGSFDKIVSIEMFESVGLAYYDEYFGAVNRLLTPEGKALIQTSTMNEGRFPAYIRSTDWIQQHVFPGAELASVAEMLKSMGRVGNLQLRHLEELGPHYVRTLQLWAQAFHEHLAEVRGLGFDEAFVRTWDYYLAISEAAFREGHLGNVQLLLTRQAY